MSATALESGIIHSGSKFALIGSDVQLTCEVGRRDRWYFVRSLNSPQAVLKSPDRVLVLRNIQLQHAGYYYCVGQREKSNKYFIDVAELQVFGKKLYYGQIGVIY